MQGRERERREGEEKKKRESRERAEREQREPRAERIKIITFSIFKKTLEKRKENKTKQKIEFIYLVKVKSSASYIASHILYVHTISGLYLPY